MNAALATLTCVGIGYACGSLPWGLWIGRWYRGVDVRELGSKNMGATNVFRSLGRGLGVATLVLDVLKGALPVWLVPRLPVAEAFPGSREVCVLAVALAAVAGHMWSFLAGFRGGKGVATTVGALVAVAPLAFLAFVAVFCLTVAATRYISLGSILGAVAFTIALAWLAPGGARSPTFGFGLVIAALVIVRHRENIRRLLAGTERRFQWSRGAGT
jgi:glycerol-3-phosphate acyltransferase PlsY